MEHEPAELAAYLKISFSHFNFNIIKSSCTNVGYSTATNSCTLRYCPAEIPRLKNSCAKIEGGTRDGNDGDVLVLL